MSNLKFAETHNLVAFLEKPKESDGFEGIIDFLNASSIRYALTVNPTIYTSCIKQFWATAKAKTVNREVQIQALVDGKKVIVTETSVRRALQLKDAEGKEMDFLVGSHLISYIDGTTPEELEKPKRKQKKGTEIPSLSGEPITDEAANVASVSIHSNDLLLSGEDRIQITELMNLCTNLKKKVLDLEEAKTAQAKEIASLKKRFKKLEKRRKSRTPGLKRLRKFGSAIRIESSNDASLGAQEDASKQGRKFTDIDQDEGVTLIDETHGRSDDNLIATTTVDELTLAQTLIEIKAAKPKAITTAATTTTTAVTRPKARGVVVQEPKEEKLARQREEDANIAEWDDVQAMIDAEYELTVKLQGNSKKKKGWNEQPIEEVRSSSIVGLGFYAREGRWGSYVREDLETLSKLVKAKHGNTRPEEGYERVLWGDLKVMFEPDVESENLHIFMLVEKKYPLTPATITEMLNKKLQADHWNEMCYQLLKLMTKQLKNPGSWDQHLDNGIYDVVELVMRPLALRQTCRPRSDHGKARHSVSLTSAHHNHGSSSHQGDDDEYDGASLASTPSLTTYLNSLRPLDYQQYDVPTYSKQNDDLLFERQSNLLNQTKQMHKELRGGFKSFGKALRGVFNKKKK
ncbi:hypothetical protein Tco_0308024 [Tanacetum coccineum]